MDSKKQKIIEAIKENRISEHITGCELKRQWKQDHGHDLSALANDLTANSKWMIIGVEDNGTSAGFNEAWAKGQEELVSQHIHQFLSPILAYKSLTAVEINGSHCILVEIANPGDVTYWKHDAYKLVGTVSRKMTPDEIMELSTRLPGADFSKQPSSEDLDPALVIEYAKNVANAFPHYDIDTTKMTTTEILGRLNIAETNCAAILFGGYPVRLVQYDESGNILAQDERRGLFTILRDEFVKEVQNWTRKQSAESAGSSISTAEETPYPRLALREVLANAVAHAMYHRDRGAIIVEMYPDRLAVTNNCPKESKAFVNKWFSGLNHAHNKLLMNTLRTARITDELGTGKQKIFRLMIEAGKPEPIIEFSEFNEVSKWKITLYNRDTDENFKTLLSRLQKSFAKSDDWRIAAALVLWRDKEWSQIGEMLDDHYKRVAQRVITDRNSPVYLTQDHIQPKRWTVLALEGVASRKFTLTEENEIRKHLTEYARSGTKDGYIENSEVRDELGMSTDRSEVTQLSNLFKKWEKEGHVRRIGKGKWRFLELTQIKCKGIQCF